MENQDGAPAATAAVQLQKRGQKNFHPFCLLAHKPSPEEWVQQATEWLVDEALFGFKTCRTKAGRSMKCSCFSILDDTRLAEAVAEYLYFFGTCSTNERDRIFMDFVRLQEDKIPPPEFEPYCYYRLPYVVSPDEDVDVEIKVALKSEYICLSALQHLLSFGRKKMKRIRSDINNGLVIPARPRIGKVQRRDLEKNGVTDALHLFFEDISEMEEPRATRLVREATGISARDTKIVDLPSYTTKRGLYRQFCYD